MTRKGFLLMLDAFMALLLLTFVLLMVVSQDYGEGTFNSLYLRSFSMGMLTSFEKSGIFARSVGNESGLRTALNNLPPSICARMTITDSSNATVSDMLREGCGAPGGQYTFYRTFYTQNELYLAKSDIWLKS